MTVVEKRANGATKRRSENVNHSPVKILKWFSFSHKAFLSCEKTENSETGIFNALMTHQYSDVTFSGIGANLNIREKTQIFQSMEQDFSTARNIFVTKGKTGLRNSWRNGICLFVWLISTTVLTSPMNSPFSLINNLIDYVLKWGKKNKDIVLFCCLNNSWRFIGYGIIFIIILI